MVTWYSGIRCDLIDFIDFAIIFHVSMHHWLNFESLNWIEIVRPAQIHARIHNQIYSMLLIAQ